METMGNLRRTHMLGELREENIGENVCLMGWAQTVRDLGALTFIDLRDYTGVTQVVIKDDDEKNFQKAKKLKPEYVVLAKGIVRQRESINKDIPTGKIEILVDELRILDKANTPPIYIKDDDDVSENMRLKYRYLDLRKNSVQNILRQRAKIVNVFRSFLTDEGFLDVDTPILTKPTPEGARDYVVPSRIHHGEFYSLPQSPQLFKQLLMVGGIDKYYQIAKCFRDEDLRANRQPEFTQVDIEMSFVDSDDVMALNERLLQRLFKEIKNIDIKLPIRRMSFDYAMNKYGSDKPDLRYDFEIMDGLDVVKNIDFNLFKSSIDNGESIKAINFSGLAKEYSRKKIDKLTEFVKGIGASGMIWFKTLDGDFSSSINKFLTENNKKELIKGFDMKDNDLVCLLFGPKRKILEILGSLRVHVAKENQVYDKDSFELVWIVDFPMFEYSEEDQRYHAKHHPFTHPLEEDIDKLETNPQEVRAKAYDIVINGDEIGGGSIRINNSDLQNRVFKLLDLDEEDIENKFGFFVEALKYGTPPHGGIAYGLDRLVMQLTGTDNIKDVIAFPKTQSATCPLTGAPGKIDEKQLEELHLKIND